MKYPYLIILFLATCQQLMANPSKDKGLLLSDQVWTMSVDPLQQIYFINGKRQLVKLSSILEKELVYSDLMIDDQTQIITQNPFKILLYKKDVGDVIALDNRLNVTVKTNFFDLGYFSVSGMTFSVDHQSIWIFDVDRQQLVKLDQQYKVQYQSHPLSQIIAQKIQPQQILAFENFIYLLDQQSGVYIFDNVGNFSKKLPIQNAEKIWIISNQIYFYRQGAIWKYDTMLFEEIPLYDLPEFKKIELSRDFILGITQQDELYQLQWKK